MSSDAVHRRPTSCYSRSSPTRVCRIAWYPRSSISHLVLLVCYRSSARRVSRSRLLDRRSHGSCSSRDAACPSATKLVHLRLIRLAGVLSSLSSFALVLVLLAVVSPVLVDCELAHVKTSRIARGETGYPNAKCEKEKLRKPKRGCRETSKQPKILQQEKHGDAVQNSITTAAVRHNDGKKVMSNARAARKRGWGRWSFYLFPLRIRSPMRHPSDPNF